MRKIKTESYDDALRAYLGWIIEAEEEALPQEADALLECRTQIGEVLGDEILKDLARLDRRYLGVVKYIGEELERTLIYPTSASFWWWHAQAISRGEYPLEKLPEHVRELALKLYYGGDRKPDRT